MNGNDMKFFGKYKENGLDFGEGKQKLLHHAKLNVDKRFVLQDLEIESKKARRFFEGAVIPMWIYLDGNDHTDSTKHKQYHNWAKEEFCPEYVMSGGKPRLAGGTTKGKLQEVTNKLIDFLEEQYSIKREEVLLPELYKRWRDTIRPFGEIDNYIDYLVSIKKL